MKENHMENQRAAHPAPPLHPHLAAVWGAFLHEGMMLSARDSDRPGRILAVWGNGYIELINAACEYLPILWTQVQPYWNQPDRFSGVFEYEVVSALGENLAGHMLANDGGLPAEREFEQIARELVQDFFEEAKTPSQNHESLRPESSRLRRVFSWFAGISPRGSQRRI